MATYISPVYVRYERVRQNLEDNVRVRKAKGNLSRQLTKDILQFDVPLKHRYKSIDIAKILHDNCSSNGGPGLEALAKGIGILEIYGKNLLRADKPAQWRTIRLSNPKYKSDVEIIKGNLEILEKLGYTKQIVDGLIFPNTVLEPDIPVVTTVSTDLLLLRQELLLLIKNRHPLVHQFFNHIPRNEIVTLQETQLRIKHESSQENNQFQSLTNDTNFLQSSQVTNDLNAFQSLPASSVTSGSIPQFTNNYRIKEQSFQPMETIRSGEPLTRINTGTTLPTVPAYQDLFNNDSNVKLNNETSSITPILSSHTSAFSTGIQRPQPVQLSPVLQQQVSNESEWKEKRIEPPQTCDVCGTEEANFKCENCPDQAFCFGCDKLWHKNPKRNWHKRYLIRFNPNTMQETNSKMPESYNTSSTVTNNENNDISQGNETTVLSVKCKQSPLKMKKIKPKEERNMVNNTSLPAVPRDTGDHNRRPGITGIFNSSLFSEPVNNYSPEYLPTSLLQQGSTRSPVSSLSNLEEVSSPPRIYSSSKSISAGDWDQKLAELMDMSDSPAKKEKMDNLLQLINKKQLNYERIIAEIRVKKPTAASLVGHLTEKLEELELIKNLVQTICLSISNETPAAGRQQDSKTEEEPKHPTENFDVSTQPTNTFPSDTCKVYSHSNFSIIDMETSPQPVSVSNAAFTFSQSQEDTQEITYKETVPATSILGKRKLTDEQNLAPSGSSLPVRELSHPSEEQSTGVLINLDDASPPETKTSKAINPLDLNEGATIVKQSNIDLLQSEYTENSEEFFVDTNSLLDMPNELEPINFTSVPTEKNGFPFIGNLGSTPFVGGMGLDSNAFSSYAPSPSKMQDLIKKETKRCESMEMVDLLRSSSKDFSPSHLNVAAYAHKKNTVNDRFSPVSWLMENWTDLKQEVQRMTIYPDPSNALLEKTLLNCNGDSQEAIGMLNSIAEVKAKSFAGDYPVNEVLNIRKTTKSKGMALAKLQKNDLNDIKMDLELNVSCIDIFVYSVNGLRDPSGEHLMRMYNTSFKKDYYPLMLKSFWEKYGDQINGEVTDKDLVESTHTSETIEEALTYLNKECIICMETYPLTKITCMPTCGDNGCQYCVTCLFQHLKICITDKNIRDITCPACGNPDIDKDEETATNHFNFIDFNLRADRQLHTLFQQKLRDFTLRRMPNFRWCSHCTGGFQFEPENEDNLKMICPYCKKGTCYKCKKRWEAQHEGINCQRFLEWKEQNDPEYQAMGLAAHLKENGIDCPDCNFRYDLAKGGCMHFKCIQCSHEFCCGCNSAFKQGNACQKFRSCGKKGLHAHHPRDCLFYLRDCSADDLQRLLDLNNVTFNIGGNQKKACQVMEQKDTPNGLKDEVCGRDVRSNQGGLCDLHFKEYLVSIVNKKHLDPAEIFDIDMLRNCLRREEKEIPQKRNMSNGDYKKLLLNEVKKLPLCHQRD